MKHVKKTGPSFALTENDKAETVRPDAFAYQQEANELNAVAGIRAGLAQAKKGMGRHAEKVFAEFERNGPTR